MAASLSVDRRVPAETTAVAPIGSMCGSPDSRSSDSTTHGASVPPADEAGVGALRQQPDTGAVREADDLAHLVEHGRLHDERGLSGRAAGRQLEANDLVDSGHEQTSGAREHLGEQVVCHRATLGARRAEDVT